MSGELLKLYMKATCLGGVERGILYEAMCAKKQRWEGRGLYSCTYVESILLRSGYAHV